MKILFWNAKGLANLDTRLVLRNLIISNKPDFIFISEPMILLDDFPARFWSRMNLKVFAVNSRGNLIPNLWCICSNDINPMVISNSNQQVSFSILWNNQIICLCYICLNNI